LAPRARPGAQGDIGMGGSKGFHGRTRGIAGRVDPADHLDRRVMILRQKAGQIGDQARFIAMQRLEQGHGLRLPARGTGRPKKRLIAWAMAS
jgi:hypothetical protein